MRELVTENGITVNAVAGTHVILLGFNLAPDQREGCLGFAIKRIDHTENEEERWLKGTKTFKATDPGVEAGGQVSSREHPFQTFQWADYSAKPDHSYTFTIVPLYGTPKNLTEKNQVSVTISTESEVGTPHSVFFNRGAVASQEYARRFKNKAPDELEGAKRDEAYQWLSRGLLEALIIFIKKAKDEQFGLFGAIYEFQLLAVLETLREASQAGVQVRVLYDGITGNGPATKNMKAIAGAQIEALCIARTTGKLMHNKFFVLTKNDKPVAVWTGSTNLTENGVYGHSNLGHLIEDETVAATYLEYWNELQSNPENAAEKMWMLQHNDNPPDPWNDDLRIVFSPRKGIKVLEWYSKIAGSVHKPLFMTFAFGMHKGFQQIYEQPDGVLRFALMEKEGNGRGLPQGRKDVARIRRLRNVVVAIGNNITTNSFDRWLKERQALSSEAHVRYIHTKYMLLDPLGDNPIVVTGSANFSEASTHTNNENMVVIRNDKRVADIYVGEFMRLYTHYAFRESLGFKQKRKKKNAPNFLIPNESWQEDYFEAGSQRSLRREYFAGL